MATKKKVFVSYDFDNDKFLKDSLIGQSKLSDSPFEITDGSLKEAAPEWDWQQKANARIKASDMVIVMLGTKTCQAPGVLKEIRMANAAKIKICQVIGYKDRNCPKIDGAGVVYDWTWSNLKTLFA